MAWEGNRQVPDDQVLDLLLTQGGWLQRASFGWLPTSYLRTMPSYYRGVEPVTLTPLITLTLTLTLTPTPASRTVASAAGRAGRPPPRAARVCARRPRRHPSHHSYSRRPRRRRGRGRGPGRVRARVRVRVRVRVSVRPHDGTLFLSCIMTTLTILLQWKFNVN